MTGLCAYLLGRIRSEMLVNGTSLFSCCLCLWGFRDFVGDDRNSCSNPYMRSLQRLLYYLFFVCEFLFYKVFPISTVVVYYLVSVSCLCTMSFTPYVVFREEYLEQTGWLYFLFVFSFLNVML